MPEAIATCEMPTVDTSRLPPRGVYLLTIRLARPARIRVGRLGRFDFPAGLYVYAGSAQRNLPARVRRHLRKPPGKPRRWHIDYLLAHPAATVVRVQASQAPKTGECDLIRQAARAGGQCIAPAFGSSDCPGPCPAHLLHMPEN